MKCEYNIANIQLAIDENSNCNNINNSSSELNGNASNTHTVYGRKPHPASAQLNNKNGSDEVRKINIRCVI